MTLLQDAAEVRRSHAVLILRRSHAVLIPGRRSDNRYIQGVHLYMPKWIVVGEKKGPARPSPQAGGG
jgi:hypothetical protein